MRSRCDWVARPGTGTSARAIVCDERRGVAQDKILSKVEAFLSSSILTSSLFSVLKLVLELVLVEVDTRGVSAFELSAICGPASFDLRDLKLVCY